MVRVICCLFLALQLGCSSSMLLKKREFNFQNSTELARHQTETFLYLTNGRPIHETTLRALQNNLWVASAEHLAPGNLVIRQFCLIDLITGRPDHAKRIARQVQCLSYGEPEDRIWAEGYSYWLYTKQMLSPWVVKFRELNRGRIVEDMAREIDDGFVNTAYSRNSVWYPAPFGDVSDRPLAEDIQSARFDYYYETKDNAAIVTVDRKDTSEIVYFIKGRSIGMNIHTPKYEHTVRVINGIPVGFEYYTGISNKYNTKEDEAVDLLDSLRVETIGECF